MKQVINTTAKWLFTFSLAGATFYLATRPNPMETPLVFIAALGTLIAFIVAVND